MSSPRDAANNPDILEAGEVPEVEIEGCPKASMMPSASTATPCTLFTSHRTATTLMSEKVDESVATAALPEKLSDEQPAKTSVTWKDTLSSTYRIASMMLRARETRFKGFGIIFFLVFLLMLETIVAAWLSQLFNEATNALVYLDSEAFYQVLNLIAFAAACHLPVVCTLEALGGTFAIEWRRCVTKNLLKKYISGSQAYYRMKSMDATIDNPDQRIGQDVAEFTVNVVKVLVTIVGSGFKVFVMSGILIAISANLYIYMLVGSVVFTVLFLKIFGGTLMRLTRLVLGQEATFRFGLIRVRENAESIAFFRGAPFELIRCTELVEKALKTYYRRLAVWVVFTGGQKAVVTFAQFLPTLLLGPSVLRGETTVGTIAQTNMLFGLLLASLTSLISDLQTLASMGAQAVRIEQLRNTLEALENDASVTQVGQNFVARSMTSITLRERESIDHEEFDGASGSDSLVLEKVSLLPPRSSEPLVSDLSLTLRKGESLLLCGESGIGKSSLLRAIGGLWAEGSGCITRSAVERSFFLPQKPYLCLGTLRENIEYPKPPTAEVDVAGSAAILQALGDVGLGYIAERHGLDTEVDFEGVLSGGEKQRLGFARLLLRPTVDFAILDESTSALDAQNEDIVYRLLAAKVPTFVSVGHRASLDRFHTHKLLLERRPCGSSSGTLQKLSVE